MDVAKVDAILDKWVRNTDYLIEILQDVQDEWRYLPEDVLHHVADSLKVPLARVAHAATFYKAFSLTPRGKHEIHVCMGTACHVKGAPRVLDSLSRELGVAPGETTKDGEYTLEAVRCVGACGLAPVVCADEEYHGDVTAAGVTKIIKSCQEGGK